MDTTILLFVLVILILLQLIYQHITRNFSYWKERDVPYLPPVLVFGNIFNVATFQRSLGGFLQDIYNYVDSRFTGFFVFDQPFLLIRDPDLIKDILIKSFDYFDNRSMLENRRHERIGSSMLLVIRNPEWKQVRIKLTPAFTTGKIKGMLYLIREVADELKNFLSEAVSKGGVVEAKEMCTKYTVDVISSCAFGINAHSFKNENAEFVVAARRIVNFTIRRSINVAAQFVAPWLAKLFGLTFIEPVSTEFIRSIFWEQMDQRKASKIKRGDLINILLQLKEEGDESLDDDVIAAQAMQFFVAGFETTATAILFTLYELAVNKDIQNRLREEIKYAEKEEEKISYETIMNMKYLNCVVSESLRKFPPLAFVERRCTKTFSVPNSSLIIQEGIPVYISLTGLHMDPAYFPEPEKFDPDRFSDENKNSIVPHTYLPFGDGPRNCIGSRFALLGAKLALTHIISDFEVDLDPRTPVPIVLDTKTSILNCPKGSVLYLRFKQYTEQHL